MDQRTKSSQHHARTEPLSWDDLRTALFLAREGSVRKAARALGVSHSTVLRRIVDLERSAGVRLFEKQSDGYEVTPAGQDVFDTAKDLDEIVTALERRVHGRDLRLAGPVRVTLPDPFLPALMPIFGEFARAYPDIELTLAVGTHFVDLAHREADVAIRVSETPPPELVGRRIVDAGVAIYGSREYLEGRSTTDLEALDWIGWESGSQMAFARWMSEHVPKARVRVRVSEGWAIRDAIDANVGVAVVPCALGETQAAWKRVRREPILTAPLWLLTHKDLRTTARVRVLREFVADAITSRRKTFIGR